MTQATQLPAEQPADQAELLKTYRQLLAGHDWYYMRSDDPTVYRKGDRGLTQLINLRRTLDQDGKIWNEYARPEFKIK